MVLCKFQKQCCVNFLLLETYFVHFQTHIRNYAQSELWETFDQNNVKWTESQNRLNILQGVKENDSS